MRNIIKKLIAAAAVLLVLIGMVTASASPGSSGNPLITLSYLSGVFAESLGTEVSSALGSAADRAQNRLDVIYRTYVGYSFAPGYVLLALAEGETVTLSTGGSFILLSGAAALTVESGTVINVSTGDEAATGSRLEQNLRYFCAENTTAVITAATALTGHVDGFYLTDGAIQAPPPMYVFTDVAENAWYFDAVDYVYRNGLFAGTSANTFSPGTPMTRGMFVTVLHRLDGRPASDAGDGFDDVADASAYYYDAVGWANANGIVTGYTDGTFRPDRSVTREEMAAIMHRYASYKGRDMQVSGDEFDAFPDSDEVSSYAVAAMRWTVSNEIIRGSGGMLLPRNTATRAEVAQIIYNYCETIG